MGGAERTTALQTNRKGVPFSQPDKATHERIGRRDLVKIGLLGCGGFGVVNWRTGILLSY